MCSGTIQEDTVLDVHGCGMRTQWRHGIIHVFVVQIGTRAAKEGGEV